MSTQPSNKPKDMIDTITLTLTNDKFHLSKPDKFTPSARWVHHPMPELHGIQSKQNPTKGEQQSGIYKPHLTITPHFHPNGSIAPMLKIQLSLPKLLFGNNLKELLYKDFKTVVTKLQAALKEMGIVATAEALVHAPVAAIHYAKNIPLTDGSTPYHYIQKIKEAYVQQALDVNEIAYRNDGCSYRWHCNTYEVVFYDKLKELEQTFQGSPQMLRTKLSRQKKFEVLRMEVRLNKRQKIKQLFNSLGIKSKLTFKKLFKPSIAKKILLHYLDEVERKRPNLSNCTKTSTKSFLATLIVNNPWL